MKTIFIILLMSLSATADVYFKNKRLVESVTTTATAAGTTTLVATSDPYQQFTGATTQTLVLPDATTLPNGWSVEVMNKSTGVISVEYDDNSAALSATASSDSMFRLIDNGTSNGTWDISGVEVDPLSLYLDGSKTMAGNIDLGNNNLVNVDTIAPGTNGIIDMEAPATTTPMYLNMTSADADGTDAVAINLYQEGKPGDTDTAYLAMGSVEDILTNYHSIIVRQTNSGGAYPLWISSNDNGDVPGIEFDVPVSNGGGGGVFLGSESEITMATAGGGGLRVSSADISPRGTSGVEDLGTTGERWKDVYTSGVVYTEDIDSATDLSLKVAGVDSLVLDGTDSEFTTVPVKLTGVNLNMDSNNVLSADNVEAVSIDMKAADVVRIISDATPTSNEDTLIQVEGLNDGAGNAETIRFGYLDSPDKFVFQQFTTGTGVEKNFTIGINNDDYITLNASTNDTDISTNLSLTTVGKGLEIKEGANAKMGRSTLVAGTVTVNTTAAKTASEIMLTCQDPNGGTPGAAYVSARVDSTSFTITSTSGTDTCVVAWVIIDPA